MTAGIKLNLSVVSDELASQYFKSYGIKYGKIYINKLKNIITNNPTVDQ